jgi:hypothetical protein
VAEQLATADGKPIDLADVDREFEAAMNAPDPEDPEHPAPPDIGPADPEAPFGRRLDGKPKTRPGGRPPKREKPRETTAAAAAGSPADYSQGLADFTEVIWMALAGTPIGNRELRIRARVQAQVLKANQAGVVSGVNIMAQHNGAVRWGVERLAGGGGAWIFPAALALMPFAVQTAALWRAPVTGDMEAAAGQAEEEFGQVFASIRDQLGLGEAQEAAA